MSKLAFIYPGQGAQKPGMGEDFYRKSPLAANIYDQASQLLDFDMKELCFTENDKLDLTEYTQAAMVTTCVAMTAVLMEQGIRPDVTAGLSLGEYCAIYAAGGMSSADAIRTVRTRGILMQNVVPLGEGGMAAVLGMDTEKIQETIAPIEGVTIANYNCPGQIIITGKLQAVQSACEALKAAGARRTLPLNVSGPFHSPMLEEAGKRLEEQLNKVEWKKLQIPYVTNVTADYVEDIAGTPQLLKQQVSSPVLWQQSVEKMIAQGVDTFIEIGPGKTLTGFLRKINRNVTVYQVGTWEEMEQVALARRNLC